MHNDLDERRRYDPRNRQSRYDQADDGRQQYASTEDHQDAYADDPHATYAEDQQGHYAEAEHGHYQAEQPVYEDVPERRSRLVPILTIVAGDPDRRDRRRRGALLPRRVRRLRTAVGGPVHRDGDPPFPRRPPRPMRIRR